MQLQIKEKIVIGQIDWGFYLKLGKKMLFILRGMPA
jgi:hypothetical protein